MNTFTKEHTQEHTHIWMGQGNHQRGARGAESGALTSVPGLHHMHGHPCQGLLQHTFLQLCSPLGHRCQYQGWGGGCTLTRGGTKLRPTFMASAPAPWDLPGPVGLGQSASTGEAFAHTGLWFLPPLPCPTAKSWLIGKDWCWEGLGAGGEGDNRGWDGWMASLTRWTWVLVNSRSLWWTGRPGVLQFMGSQRVGYDWATELNWTELKAH